MPAFTPGTKNKVISSIKRAHIHVQNYNYTSGVENMQTMVWIPRLGSVTPLEFDFSYGPDGVVASYMEWHLVLADIDNLPQVEGARDRSLWTAAQRWLGTATEAIQTMSREVQDFFNPATVGFTEMADFTTRGALIMAVVATSGSVGFSGYGILTYREDIIQRTWGGDNWTFDDYDRKNGEGLCWGDFMCSEEEGAGYA